MKRYLYLFIASTFGLFSCGDRESSLIGQLNVTPVVNPNVGILIKNGIVSTCLVDQKKILGVAGRLVFETNDNFKTFQVSNPFENDLSNIAYLTSSSIVCFNPPVNQYYDPITIYRSTNKGGSWKKSVIQNISNDVSRSFVVMKIQFINENLGMMLVNNSSFTYPTRALIYEIDIDKSTARLLGQVEDGYSPVEMKFFDTKVGYVLLRSYLQNNNAQNTYISRTIDGGNTWSKPNSVDTNTRLFSLEIADQKNIIIFESNLLYYSDNGGTSFRRIESSRSIKDISFVGGLTGFSIDSGGAILKSTNGGLSWILMGNIEVPGGNYRGEFQKIDFYNESDGIVYGRNQLYFTGDGGQSWDILIFPFSYVTGD